jgi:hypothetical protein
LWKDSSSGSHARATGLRWKCRVRIGPALRLPLRQDRPPPCQDDNTRELSWSLMLALRTRGGPPAPRSGEEGDIPAEWLAKYVENSCSYGKSWVGDKICSALLQSQVQAFTRAENQHDFPRLPRRRRGLHPTSVASDRLIEPVLHHAVVQPSCSTITAASA